MAPVICTAFYDTNDALARMNAYNHQDSEGVVDQLFAVIVPRGQAQGIWLLTS